MSDFYQEAAEAASEMLEEFGAPLILIREIEDDFDPIKGETIEVPDLQISTTGVTRLYRKTLIDGTLIMQGDKELILDPKEAPTTQDRMLIDGKEWQIVGVEPVAPASVVLLYFVQIRRS